jgi:hypothetical protein
MLSLCFLSLPALPVHHLAPWTALRSLQGPATTTYEGCSTLFQLFERTVRRQPESMFLGHRTAQGWYVYNTYRCASAGLVQKLNVSRP